MKDSFIKKINNIRNPFKIISLPFLFKIYKIWGNLNNPKILRKAARSLFKAYYKAGITGKGKFIYKRQNDEIELTFNLSNTQYHSIYFNHYLIYEIEIATLLDILVPDDGVFYDVGSNFGHFSLFIASKPNFTGKIYSFEANPNTFNDLQSMVEQAKLGDIISSHCIGISSTKGKGLLLISNNIDSGIGKIDDSGDIEITLDRLDNLDIPRPDVMKIDVEGHEFEVIKSCSGFLKESSPFIIFESRIYGDFKDSSFNVLKTLKNDYDYSFFYPLVNDVEMTISLEKFFIKDHNKYPDGCNVLAVPNSKKGDSDLFC